MAAAVDRCLSSGRHLVVEAGTGVGKSFAYLVPALAHAAATGQRVAVATSTIALQEQLVRKDLPLLEEALPFPTGHALVKGRSNYLCLRRMHRALASTQDLFGGEESRALARIADWSTWTTEGSRQDLPEQPPASVWEAVQAEQGNCLGRACPHYEACPYQASRRRAHEAPLLVLNHHLLMSDLALRRSGGSFLPAVDAVVVDEAHDLEDTAAQHLGRRVTWRGVRQLLGRLWSARGRSGLLAALDLPQARAAVESAAGAADEFFDGVCGEGDADGNGRLAPGRHLGDALSPRLEALSSLLLSATRALPDRETAMEVTARARAVAAAAEALRGLAEDDDPEQVRWIEASGEGRAALCSAPVDVGPLLRDALFDAHESVILTSATLAAGDPPGFAYVRERLGLVEADEAAIGSPFRFRECVRVRVRADLPDPARMPEAYAAALGPAVLDAIRFSGGGALVLFTSVRDMRRVADEVREAVEAMDLVLLVQGEGLERPALLDAFRGGGAVLFGVASFWQGVDVPGDALRHVVIARLPFEVPTHPLQKARAERLEASGRSAFRHLSLPMAALRLKQGFGRLIRRHDDSGWVTILDSRVAHRSYGRALLAALPECPVDFVAGEPDSGVEVGSDRE